MIWLALPALAAPEWPALDHPAPAEGAGSRDAALVIAVEDYLLIDDVPGGIANGDDWVTWLTRTRGVPADRVRVLRNHEAAREAILDEMDALVSRAEEGGWTWVVFIGHGAPSRDGRDGLLVGVDAQASARSITARSVAQRELLAALDGSAAAQSVVVLDACFSGQSAAGALVPGLQPMVPSYAQPTTPALVFSAGASDQFAGPLPGAERPAFSYLLLGALRGWGDANADGAVSAAEAVRYAEGALTALLTDRRQVPALSGGDPQTALSAGRERGPDLYRMVRGATSEPEVVAALAPTPTPHPEPAVSVGEDLCVDLELRARELRRDPARATAWFREHPDQIVWRAGAAGLVIGLPLEGEADALLRSDPECRLKLDVSKHRPCGTRPWKGWKALVSWGEVGLSRDRPARVDDLRLQTHGPTGKPWRTADGLELGTSTLADAIALYGEPDRRTPGMAQFDCLGAFLHHEGADGLITGVWVAE